MRRSRLTERTRSIKSDLFSGGFPETIKIRDMDAVVEELGANADDKYEADGTKFAGEGDKVWFNETFIFEQVDVDGEEYNVRVVTHTEIDCSDLKMSPKAKFDATRETIWLVFDRDMGKDVIVYKQKGNNYVIARR